MTGQLEVSEKNSIMNGRQRINSFQFDDDPAFYEKINTVPAFQLRILVDNRNRFLALHPQSTQNQLSGQTFFVC